MHLAGKRFPSPSPRRARGQSELSWGGQGGPQAPAAPKGAVPCPAGQVPGRGLNVVHRLSRCVRGKAGPAAGVRGLRGPWTCTGSLHLLVVSRPAAGSVSREWCRWHCVTVGPCGPAGPHRSARGERCSSGSFRAGSSQHPLDQRVPMCGLGARCRPHT